MPKIYQALLGFSCLSLGACLQKQKIPIRELLNMDPERAQVGGEFLDEVPRPDCLDLEEAIQNGMLEDFPSSSHYHRWILDAQKACKLSPVAKDLKGSVGYVDVTGFFSTGVHLHKPMRLLHVSKSSGTFFCDCAHHVGLNRGLRHDEYMNCHFLDEDQPQWGFHDLPQAFMIYNESDIHQTDCQELADVSKTRGIDVEGNENYLPSYGLCSQFYNVMIFRDPIMRLLSHLVTINGRDREGEDRLMNHTMNRVIEQWPQIVDNFYTRNLAGYDAFKLPFGKITEEHLKVAKARLAQFDEIFIADASLAYDMHNRLGWDCVSHTSAVGLGRTNTVQGNKLEFAEELRGKWGDEQYKHLIEINNFDVQLFKQALLLNSVAGRQPTRIIM